ncbi:nitrogen regulation protein NR(II) [Gemmatimonadota bacterium]
MKPDAGLTSPGQGNDFLDAASREWLQHHLFNEVPVSISVISPDYRIVEGNRRFTEEYGEWKGRECYEVYKGRSERCKRCAAAETFADGKIRTREEEGTYLNGGTSHYLVQMVPIIQPDGKIPYVIEMSTDITQVKRLELEKREAQRLAAVGETVAGIAHGIKNVLMGLEGGLYAVNTGIEQEDDERIARGWMMVEENVNRISQFVKEFLDFARGREATVSIVDPAKPLREVVELFMERAAQSGILMRVDIEEGIMPATLDEEGIHTCLANLISNAIDACTFSERKSDHTVSVSMREEGDMLVYEVMDDGQGMDYEVSKKVFSKFFSTKGSDHGTGLGLLTTKKIIHQHGGQISFTSEEGIGSTFRIELPREYLPKPDAGDQSEPISSEPIE